MSQIIVDVSYDDIKNDLVTEKLHKMVVERIAKYNSIMGEKIPAKEELYTYEEVGEILNKINKASEPIK